MATKTFNCPYAVDADKVPWVNAQPGISAKPLWFLPDWSGWALLLRLEPGAVVARHRHTGEVHGLVLQGQRRLLDTGDVVGRGGYVYEPPGNVDSWMAIGDEPLVCFVVVHGDVEYLGEDGAVTLKANARTQYDAYVRQCAKDDVPAVLEVA